MSTISLFGFVFSALSEIGMPTAVFMANGVSDDVLQFLQSQEGQLDVLAGYRDRRLCAAALRADATGGAGRSRMNGGMIRMIDLHTHSIE